MYTVYVLQNSDGVLYKGQTQDLDKRIDEHNNSQSAKTYTSARGPWKLVYQEIVKTRSQAMKREKFLKSGAGRDYLQRVLASH